ncbi:hypothetical protein BEP19_08580 [Ammoniphilus oxalaticus]|uniref:PEP-utilising enzyme mobile domain-containing protein n=1 Tax=Ammoniphilus oxalaticus TaxID=66863 RepID=A0A419SK76_9BACL|nr:PEP-utilizing enzyme [Ammoniphilus oxalaticus]RKD24434.1 hypothetical protein BEP19_08580 [Ammoniphilus oxalaticus]
MKFERDQLFLTEEHKQQGYWIQDDLHLPYPLTPLFASFQTNAMREGTARAFETIKSPMKQFYTKIERGYLYQMVKPYDGPMEQRMKEHQEAVAERFGRNHELLEHYVLTELLPVYARLDAFRQTDFTREQAIEQCQQLYLFYLRAWEIHFEIVMPGGALLSKLEALYCELSGADDGAVIYEWLVGMMNKTLETDRAMWKLADQVKGSAELTRLFDETDPAELIDRLAEVAQGPAFLASLATFLDDYGYQATHPHEFVAKTWIEDPTPVLTIVAQYAQKEYDFDAEFAKLVEKRENAFEAVVATFPDGEKKQRFLQLYEWALASCSVDEDHHFYIDAMLPAKSRLFFIAVGQKLVEAGALREANDICFLYLDEVIDLLAEPIAIEDRIVERKQDWEANRLYKPIPSYGTAPTRSNKAAERMSGGKQAEVEGNQFKGYAASQGTYTGQVKVIHDPSEFSAVEQGDVLVCRTTTPTWTALFSIVGAVVTDAGGILCHAATVAREYQLPAVVGSKVGTSLLQDGQTVTVDGAKGLVIIHE